MAELEAIREYFFGLTSKGEQRRIVLFGKGGMEKTQLALGFPRQYKEHSSAIFIDAQPEEPIVDSFTDALDYIYLKLPKGVTLFPDRKLNTKDGIVSKFLEWLSQWLPPSNNGSIIITMRLPELARVGNAVLVVGILVRYAPLNDTDESGYYSVHDLSHAFCQEHTALVDNHAKLPLARAGLSMPTSGNENRGLSHTPIPSSIALMEQLMSSTRD